MATSSMFSDEERKSFRVLFRMISMLRDLEPDMPVTQALCFAWVALNEGRTQVELRLDLGITSSTASRSLAALSKVHRLRKPGMGLIEWTENFMDRRAKLLSLTPKGRTLARNLVALVI